MYQAKAYILLREQVRDSNGAICRPRSEMVFLIYEDSGGKYGSLIQYCGEERKPMPEFYWVLKSSKAQKELEINEVVQSHRYYNIELLRKLWKSMVAHEGFAGKRYKRMDEWE